eukprot:GHVR01078730.1.p1 GENE.GHVR01078730.1~~GHVR01078730.1.p1  ORF type:complete len:340 (+),score=44.58 GHVR01078730.1:61-1080(+)
MIHVLLSRIACMGLVSVVDVIFRSLGFFDLEETGVANALISFVKFFFYTFFAFYTFNCLILVNYSSQLESSWREAEYSSSTMLLREFPRHPTSTRKTRLLEYLQYKHLRAQFIKTFELPIGFPFNRYLFRCAVFDILDTCKPSVHMWIITIIMALLLLIYYYYVGSTFSLATMSIPWVMLLLGVVVCLQLRYIQNRLVRVKLSKAGEDFFIHFPTADKQFDVKEEQDILNTLFSLTVSALYKKTHIGSRKKYLPGYWLYGTTTPTPIESLYPLWRRGRKLMINILQLLLMLSSLLESFFIWEVVHSKILFSFGRTAFSIMFIPLLVVPLLLITHTRTNR